MPLVARNLSVPGGPEDNPSRLVHNRSVLLRGVVETVTFNNYHSHSTIGEIAMRRVTYPRGIFSLFSVQRYGWQGLVGADIFSARAFKDGAPLEELEKSHRFVVREVGEDLVINEHGEFLLASFSGTVPDVPHVRVLMNSQGEISFTDKTAAGTWLAADWEHTRLTLPLQRMELDHQQN